MTDRFADLGRWWWRRSMTGRGAGRELLSMEANGGLGSRLCENSEIV
jgi:hypothetical protein